MRNRSLVQLAALAVGATFLLVSILGFIPSMMGGGVAYLFLTVYGSVVEQDSRENFVPINTADNLLHLALGVGMIGIGDALGRQAARGPALGAR